MNFKYITFTLLLLFPSLFSFSIEINSGQGISFGDKIKLIKAKNRLRYNDQKTAYNLIYEVYQKDEKNPIGNFWMGKCLLASEDYKKAVQHLEMVLQSSEKLNKETRLYLGIAYHRSGDIDKALIEFEHYKQIVSPSRAKRNDLDKFVLQCNAAKEQMKNPQKVKIINLGSEINSKYPDYSPSVTADGKTLIFTSRRPDTKGKKVDENDYMFYEDIYMSRWNESAKSWTTATNEIEGLLNTKFHDANLSISANGKQILIYRNVPGQTKSGDIYYSDLNNSGKWSEPKSFGTEINTSYFESSACITPDGKTLYFVSERKSGKGRGDIYVSRKTSNGDWIEAENIGDLINTADDEISLFLHPDGKTLYFSSDARGGLGGYDIYKTTVENDVWSQPVNLGYPINTVGDDLYFTITSDNVAYYVSDQESGLGAEDIYQVQFSVAEVKDEVQLLSESTGKKEELVKEIEKVIVKKEVETPKEEIKTDAVQPKEEKEVLVAEEKKKPVAKSNKNIFETIYVSFADKESDLQLNEASEADLSAILDYLTQNPSVKVQVSANESGNSYQSLLSQNRSWNIANYFRKNGVKYSNVIITSGNDKGVNRVAVKILK
jgi:outer membrane protein OmpA-like peptidoglycan-associated protein/tetratricopeptide (TPR) repeat protein